MLFTSSSDHSLPPIVLNELQRALSKGTFFKDGTDNFHCLPRPNFPHQQQNFLSNFQFFENNQIPNSWIFEQALTESTKNVFRKREQCFRDLEPGSDSDLSSYQNVDTTNKRRKKIVLSAAQAQEIFAMRPTARNWAACLCASSSPSARSRELAERYGVSAKTVRDIWQRLTWSGATSHLWTNEEKQDHLLREHAKPQHKESSATRPTTLPTNPPLRLAYHPSQATAPTSQRPSHTTLHDTTLSTSPLALTTRWCTAASIIASTPPAANVAWPRLAAAEHQASALTAVLR